MCEECSGCAECTAGYGSRACSEYSLYECTEDECAAMGADWWCHGYGCECRGFSSPGPTPQTRDASASFTPSPTPLATPRTPKLAVTSEFVMSDDSIAAMQANPSAAVEGLRNGIAEALEVDPALVELTRTVPDLLTRQLAALHVAAESSPPWAKKIDTLDGYHQAGRRLESTLIVDFEVAITEESSIAETVDSLVTGDESISAILAFSVERGLKEQSIDASVESVTASGGELVDADPGSLEVLLPPPPPPPKETEEVEIAGSTAFGQVGLSIFAVMYFCS